MEEVPEEMFNENAGIEEERINAEIEDLRNLEELEEEERKEEFLAQELDGLYGMIALAFENPERAKSRLSETHVLEELEEKTHFVSDMGGGHGGIGGAYLPLIASLVSSGMVVQSEPKKPFISQMLAGIKRRIKWPF